MSPIHALGGQPQSPVQATYKFVQSPPVHANPQSPPQTAIVQPLSSPNAFELRQKSYIQFPDSTLHVQHGIPAITKNIRSRSPSPCIRHKKHCAPNKSPRVSSPTINSNNTTEKNPLIRQALTSPPLTNIIDKPVEARSSMNDFSNKKDDETLQHNQSSVQSTAPTYCLPPKQQQHPRAPLNTLPSNDNASEMLFQPQDHRISTTTVSKDDNNTPLLPVRLSILQQRVSFCHLMSSISIKCCYNIFLFMTAWIT